jgi:type IV pilus assembly protein PilA
MERLRHPIGTLALAGRFQSQARPWHGGCASIAASLEDSTIEAGCEVITMRQANSRGFSLIELMIVVVVIGVLAAIAIPNFLSMRDRAKEGSTKANMHTFQLSAEDYGVRHEGAYADLASTVYDLLPGQGATFMNPFTNTTGDGASFEDRATLATAPTTTSGLVSYADSSQVTYNIKGYGKGAALNLVLTAGE